jgi:hypothetical protein
MAKKVWQEIKVQFCDHAGTDVALEAEVLYPDDLMPDTPPRIVAHRCERGLECGLMKEASCVWAGSNPNYDPFSEKQKK